MESSLVKTTAGKGREDSGHWRLTLPSNEQQRLMMEKVIRNILSFSAVRSVPTQSRTCYSSSTEDVAAFAISRITSVGD